MIKFQLNRRNTLSLLATAASWPMLAGAQTAAGTTTAATAAATAGATTQPATRPIPSSGEALPIVGLGSWITFNVGNDASARARCAAVMAAFFSGGGTLIDSSPMYGSSQDVIGQGLRIGHSRGESQGQKPSSVFSADKVWVAPGSRGPAQVEESRRLWGVPRFDLLQVHNLLAWQDHLPMLLRMKAAGQLRYVGISTSEGRRHDEIEQIMRSHAIDFVQLTYSLRDRRAEQRLLPLAQERGIAVIVNRPFEQGSLLRSLAAHPLPGWAAEMQSRSWAQFALAFALSHPAVTCAIPATTQVAHVRENLAVAARPLPDAQQRQRMAAATQDWV